MLQAAVRAWPPRAIHDSVDAVMRTAPYRRSLTVSAYDRIIEWIARAVGWLISQLGGLPSGRTIVEWAVALLVVLLLGRLVLAAVARDPERQVAAPRGRLPNEDPWRAAERLAAAGDHEGAAHAIYRGVLASVTERERLRRDPSKTSGDYVRELRSRGSASHQPFRAFARRFDAAIYGKGTIDAELVADLRRLAQPLRGEARAA